MPETDLHPEPADSIEYIIVSDNPPMEGGRKVLAHTIGITKALKVKKALTNTAANWKNLKIEKF